MTQLRRFLMAGVVCALAGTAVFSATLNGTVRNATTGAPAVGVDVVLISLQSGMDSLASTRTDAQGRFQFDHTAIGTAPLLVRVVYRSVNYHANVPPGQTTASIEIFDTTSDPGSIEVATRLIVFQPDGETLLIGEEFTVHNHSKPPLTFARNEGTFEFATPEGAQMSQVSAWGQAGMPLVQGTIDKAPGRYAIAFALKPGENGIRLSYTIPYPSNQATVRLVSPYAVQRVLLIAPPSMAVSGEGFAPAGSEQGWNLYARESVAANAALQVNVSGTAPPPSAEGQEDPAAGLMVGRQPGRLNEVKWMLLAGFSVLFVLGVIVLMRRPPGVTAAPAVQHGGAHAAEMALPPMGAAGGGDIVAQVMADAEREARQMLEGVKEQLFRLELRRQSGAISDEQYAQERRTAEEKLRALMKP
ncbi:MAG TPA: carboxypeptidase-like regulatory domain-containing protein [Candidatus Acidoferrales bacterium]